MTVAGNGVSGGVAAGPIDDTASGRAVELGWWGYCGPGLFCVGYTIGPGTVMKQSQAAAEAGWLVLALLPVGIFLFWAMLEASGCYALATGESVLHGLRHRLPGSSGTFWLIVTGCVAAHWTGLAVLTGTIANLVAPGDAAAVPPVAVGLLCAVGILLGLGRWRLVEGVVGGLALLMAAGFVLAALLSLGRSGAGAAAAPDPNGGDPLGLVTAMTGLALAVPTFLVRSLRMLQLRNGNETFLGQRRDAGMAAAVALLVAGSVVIRVCGGATGKGGLAVGSGEFVRTIAGSAGEPAGAFFLLGIVAAGLSSIIPMAALLPLLLGELPAAGSGGATRRFRLLSCAGCAAGLAGLLLGPRLEPLHRIASLGFQAVVVPVAVGGLLVLINRADLLGAHRARVGRNAGLAATTALALFGAWRAGASLLERFA